MFYVHTVAANLEGQREPPPCTQGRSGVLCCGSYPMRCSHALMPHASPQCLPSLLLNCPLKNTAMQAMRHMDQETLEAQYLMPRDQEIRRMDLPERFQLLQVGMHEAEQVGPTGEEPGGGGGASESQLLDPCSYVSQ